MIAAAAVVLAVVGTLAIQFLALRGVNFDNLNAVLLLIVALSSVLFARALPNPRHVLYPIGAAVILLPAGLLWLAGTLGAAELILAAIILNVLGIFLVVRLSAEFRQDPLELVPKLLVSAISGTTPGTDRCLPLELEARWFRADGAAFATFLKGRKLVSFARRGGTGVTLVIGRVNLRRTTVLSFLWILFGSTKITLTPNRARVSVEPMTYAFLDRPAPYSRYCANLVSLLQGEYEEFRSNPPAEQVGL